MRVTPQNDFVLLSQQMWLQTLQGSGLGDRLQVGFREPGFPLATFSLMGWAGWPFHPIQCHPCSPSSFLQLLQALQSHPRAFSPPGSTSSVPVLIQLPASLTKSAS